MKLKEKSSKPVSAWPPSRPKMVLVLKNIMNPNSTQESHVKSYKKIVSGILQNANIQNANKPESIMGDEEVWIF